jgi:hypothetical protein
VIFSSRIFSFCCTANSFLRRTCILLSVFRFVFHARTLGKHDAVLPSSTSADVLAMSTPTLSWSGFRRRFLYAWSSCLVPCCAHSDLCREVYVDVRLGVTRGGGLGTLNSVGMAVGLGFRIPSWRLLSSWLASKWTCLIQNSVVICDRLIMYAWLYVLI